MEQINFSDLNLSINNNTKTIIINDKEIEVLQYLPIEDKFHIIMTTLSEALDEGVYNPVKIELFFSFNLIVAYTNINFLEENLEEYEKLYDKMESNELFNKVISAIPEDEYSALVDMFEETRKIKTEYNMTISSFIAKMQKDLPKLADSMQEVVNNFDPEKYKEVINFAQYANGNRTIDSNIEIPEE